MAHTSPRVLIAGGGIGGLCLAQGLHRAGVAVAVFERAPSPDSFREGYRIHIDPDGSRALHACLPEAQFSLFEAACGRAPRSFAFLTERFDELLTIDVPPPDPADPIAIHRSINRFRLRQVLLDGLGDRVHFGREFVRYATTPDGGVTAHFADGSAETGRLLVGAEGARSRVRAQLLPGPARVDTGVVSVAGRVPLNADVRSRLPHQVTNGVAMVLAPGGVNMFLAPHEHTAGVSAAYERDGGASLPAHLLPPSKGDYLVWAVTARRSSFPSESTVETLKPEALRDLAGRMVAAWPEPLRRLVADTEPSTLTATSVRSCAPIRPWASSNVTLLGDAIHSMPPSRGVGANTALRDASLLCRTLIAAGDGDLIAAVADYESQMRRYAAAAVKASERALRQSVTANPVAFAASKAMLRAANAMLKLKRRNSPSATEGLA